MDQISSFDSIKTGEREVSEPAMSDVDKVRQHTSQIRNLFDILKSRLPVALYYHYAQTAHVWLYYYKCFLEHLQALDLDAYKYNLEQLSVFELELRKELNGIRRIATDHRRGCVGYNVDLDAIAELAIDWSEV